MLLTIFATVRLEWARSAFHSPSLALFSRRITGRKLGRLVQNFDRAFLLLLLNLQAVLLVFFGRLDKFKSVSL